MIDFFKTAYKGQNHWWMYIVTLVIVFIATQLGSLPLGVVAFFYSDKNMSTYMQAAADNFMGIGIPSNLFLFLMLLPFVVGLLFLYISIRFIHKKKWKWVITSRESIDWKRFFFGAIVWGLMIVAFKILSIFVYEDAMVWNFNPIPFFILVVISFILIPLQTTFEEVIFRGYLMQAFGMLVGNRWFPLLFTSIVFGLLHIANPEIEKLGYTSLILYVGSGLLFGMITLLDEGTELVLGMHAVNNIVAAFLITTDWTVFQTDALYLDTSEPNLQLEFIGFTVLFVLILVIFQKKYKWNHWKEKLTGKVVKPEVIE